MIAQVFQIIAQTVQHRHQIGSFVRQQRARSPKLPLMLLGLLVALTATIAMPVATSAASANQTGAYSCYQSYVGSFGLCYPDGWIPTYDTSDGALWMSDASDSAATFDVLYNTVPTGQRGAEYARAHQASYVAGLSGYTPIQQQIVLIAGQQAPVFEYTYTDQGSTIHEVTAYLTQGSDAWILVFDAPANLFSRYTPDATLLIGSFTLL